MKTFLLCALFLIVGAVAGSALSGYFVDRFHKRYYAILFAGDLGSRALQAELIKQGGVSIVLTSLENSFPDHVIAIRKNELLRDNMTADTALMATKRFYVCTGTSIPAQIGQILEPVSLPEDACGSQP